MAGRKLKKNPKMVKDPYIEAETTTEKKDIDLFQKLGVIDKRANRQSKASSRFQAVNCKADRKYKVKNFQYRNL